MSSNNRKILLGGFFILLGGLFFLDNFGFFGFDFRYLIFSWHSIFVIIGIIILLNHKNSLLGYIFLIIGLFGIMRHTIPYFFSFDFGDLWPLILLAVGLWLVFQKRDAVRKFHSTDSFENFQNLSSTSTQDVINETCIFNTCRRKINSENFKGGDITAIFGAAKIDLTEAKLAPGENTLDITTLFGGCEIRIPQNWKVLLNVTSIFGGFDDKRYSQVYSENSIEGILIIKGAAIFGGGELIY